MGTPVRCRWERKMEQLLGKTVRRLRKKLKKRIAIRSSNPQKRSELGSSLAVQWLRICLPMQATRVRSLVRELRSHAPQGN